MRKQEGVKKGSFSRQRSQDVLRLEDLRVGKLREESDTWHCCNMVLLSQGSSGLGWTKREKFSDGSFMQF